jgi:putative phosphoesterase
MKLLIMSDSHRRIDLMRTAVDESEPDAVLHLGDHFADARELSLRYPGLAFHMVTGNCDYETAGADSELFLAFEDVRIYMAHGHQYAVKNGLHPFIASTRRMGADLALFGHTHKALIHKARGLTIMNPGQMLRHDGGISPSYGIVTVASGKFQCEIVNLPL